jgi:hypothetical protein
VISAWCLAISRPRFSSGGRVLAFYFLGRIAEEQGDAASARERYQRYLDHWGDGDFDREQVDHARRVVGAS